MKEFDIEKLKRENIFKTPDCFFEDMQKKVLQETFPAKLGGIINLNWAYGAAAAVAILVGVSLFVNSVPTTEPQLLTKIAPVEKDVAAYALPDDKPEKKQAIAIQTLEQDLTYLPRINQKTNVGPRISSNKGNANFANQKEQKESPNTEFQVDQILATFTSAEMEKVGKNTEQDIYLDLYN